LDPNKKDGKVIFVTSTVASEGKTFTTINLGHSIAHSGKKTVVIGLDLRAPKLKQYLNIPQTTGVSNYIVKTDLVLKDILIQSEENEHLSYILSGDIPPNPSELLMRDRLTDLFEQLKKEFDYILVDTAPVGLVADTLHTSPMADLVLYVVRAKLIDKRMLNIPVNLYKDKKLGNMAILVNGTDIKRSQYGYGYGYGYGQDLKKKKGFLGWFKK
jgi:capsular exopolysaccharide synthesis family protein